MTNSIDLGPIRSSHEAPPAERADAAANRARILDEAKALFEARGVGEVTMADIATAAGVGKGTIYRRFASKGELCLSIMDDQLRAYQDETLASFRQQRAARVDALTILGDFLESWIGFTEAQLPLMCEVQRDGLHADDHTAPYFWLHMTVVGLLRAAAREDRVRPDVDLSLAADLLLAPLRADMLRFLREGRDYSQAEIARGLREHLGGLT